MSPHAELILERTARILADEVRAEARARFGAETGEPIAGTGTDGVVLPFRSRRS